jgi:hypothetical protein
VTHESIERNKRIRITAILLLGALGLLLVLLKAAVGAN